MELKVDILGWWQRKKAKKLKAERECLLRSRKLYRGQSLKLQGRVEDVAQFIDRESKA